MIFGATFEREIWRRRDSCGRTNHQEKVTKHCIVLLDSKDKIVATLAKPRRCIFPHFCSAVDLGEKKKSTTCSGESVIGALAKEIAVLVERAEANSAISCVVHF